MLRKILILLVILIASLWLIFSKLMTGKLITLISNLSTDSFLISYSNIRTSNFLSGFEFSIDQPNIVINLNNNVLKFSANRIFLQVDMKMSNIRLFIDNPILLEKHNNHNISNFKINLEGNNKIELSLSKPLSLFNKSRDNDIRNININGNEIIVSANDNELYSISDANFFLNFTSNEINSPNSSNILLKFIYKRLDGMSNFDQAFVDVGGGIYKLDNGKKSLNISNLNISLDNIASLRVNGELSLIQDFGKIPVGKFKINLNNSDLFIDKIMPSGYENLSLKFKEFLLQATRDDLSGKDYDHKLDDNLDFDIILSDNNIRIGSQELENFYNQDRE